jgi:hypothetical protein
MAGLVNHPFKIAHIANDVRILPSGNSKRIARYYTNKSIGRNIVRRIYLR